MGFSFSQLVFGSIQLLLTIYSDKYKDLDQATTFPNNPDNFLLPQTQEYDFIVVGGGTAGCVVAAKLSEKYSVLLLESGGDPLPQTYLPANYRHTRYHPGITHRLWSIKQDFGGNDGVHIISHGNILGGTSTINGMAYNRGNPIDYQNWARITSDDQWNYENLLEYFKMSENFIGEENDHLGKEGPYLITKKNAVLNEQELKWHNAWLEAGEELGFGNFENSNGPQKIGFGPTSHSLHNGERVSSYTAFLKPVEGRENLEISKYSKATKININEDGVAVGISYEKHGVNKYAIAKKEIILCAGSFNSPHILMNSGVGPQDQLNQAGIPVKVDLPVGQTFIDHALVPIMGVFFDKPNYENLSEKNIEEYIANRTGPLANLEGTNAQAFIVTNVAKEAGSDPNWPDIQFSFAFESKEINGSPRDEVVLVIELGLPQSVGTLKLNTTNPLEPLIWDPNFLGNERDLNAMAEGAEILIRVAESKAFEQFGTRIEKVNIPGCENELWGSSDYWKCFIKQKIEPHCHPTSSCKMGNESDPSAVVLTNLKVKGLQNVRVVDNSIHPYIINSNTMAPAIMIGQKGADLILKDHP